MTPSNHRITRALALLMFAGAVTVLAVPASAQTLDKALAAQGEADKAAAASQKRINEIRDRTQDAASRYATAQADSEKSASATTAPATASFQSARSAQNSTGESSR
jgi:hypothetical protein